MSHPRDPFLLILARSYNGIYYPAPAKKIPSEGRQISGVFRDVSDVLQHLRLSDGGMSEDVVNIYNTRTGSCSGLRPGDG
jgi:hypothetical protein